MSLAAGQSAGHLAQDVSDAREKRPENVSRSVWRNFANYRLRLLLACGVDWHTAPTPRIRNRRPRLVRRAAMAPMVLLGVAGVSLTDEKVRIGFLDVGTRARRQSTPGTSRTCIAR